MSQVHYPITAYQFLEFDLELMSKLLRKKTKITIQISQVNLHCRDSLNFCQQSYTVALLRLREGVNCPFFCKYLGGGGGRK